MPRFDYDAWYQSLEPTDQWLLEWRTVADLSLREIAEKTGLETEDVRHRLLLLRGRLFAQVRENGANP